MMKNLPIILNIVLLLAVGYLYYYDFSGKKTKDVAAKLSSNFKENDSDKYRPAIAYVELDSLNEKITFIKEKRKELEAELKAIEQEHQTGYNGLEAQRDNFLKRGAAITDEEVQAFQGKLIEQQQKIDTRKQEKSQKLNEKSFNIMDGIQKKLKDFLAEYNKEKKYQYIFTTGTGLEYMVVKDSSLNITNDVIQGMNAKMKAEAKQ